MTISRIRWPRLSRLPIEQPSSRVVIIALALGLAAFFGLAIAILPLSLMSRVAIVLAGGVVLIAALADSASDENRTRKGLLLVLVATVFLSIFWPRYSFLKTSEHLPRLNPLAVCELLALLAIAFHSVKSKAFRAALADAAAHSPAIAWLFLLLVAWRFIAACFGEHPIDSIMLFMKDIVYVFSFFAIGLALGKRPDGVRLICVTLAAAAIVVTGLAVVEYFTHRNIFTLVAMDDETGALGAQMFLTTVSKMRDGTFRAQSSFDHPILLAQFSAAFLPVMVQLVRIEKRFIHRMTYLAGVALLLAGVYVARSRTGVVVVALVFVLFLLLELVSRIHSEMRGKGIVLISIFAPVVILIGALLVPVIADVTVGQTASEISSTNTRMQMIANAMPQVMESPLVGYGQGMATYLAGMGTGLMVTLDSYYLTLLLDHGIPELILFSVFCIGIWLRSLVCAGTTAERQLIGACGITVLATFASLSIVSIPNNAILIYLLGGATAAFWSRLATRETAE